MVRTLKKAGILLALPAMTLTGTPAPLVVLASENNVSEDPGYYYPVDYLKNEDEVRYLVPGQTVQLEIPDSYYDPDGILEFRISITSSDPLRLIDNQDGSITAREKGIYRISYNFIPTQESLKAFKEKYPNHPFPKNNPADLTIYVTDDQLVFRLYNPNSGEHVYTADLAEKNMLVKAGWRDENVAWISPKQSSEPIYRLYNPNAGDHHYTTDKREADHLSRIGWNNEGIFFYGSETRTHAVYVYRLYNPNATAGAHHFTLSASERDHLSECGWKYEQVGWYALANLPIYGISAR